MHLPDHHAEYRVPVLHEFIRQNPLGVLTTALRSETVPFLQSSHIPWVIDSVEGESTSYGKLRGHIARQNPQAKAIVEHVGNPPESSFLSEDVLVVFTAPVQHYVTPKFYVETKPQTGKVVPTWDYEAVQVYGKARVYIDSRSEETVQFLTTQINDLSRHAESYIMGHGIGDKGHIQPWEVREAPDRYVDLLRKNIIGIEIEIGSIAGRFKMSQEKNINDRKGVIEGMRLMGGPYAEAMSDMIQIRANEYDERKAALKENRV